MNKLKHMFANMRIDLNISRKFDLKIVNLKQKVRSLSLEMANINLIFYKIRKWSRACALTQLLRCNRPMLNHLESIVGPVSSISRFVVCLVESTKVLGRGEEEENRKRND